MSKLIDKLRQVSQTAPQPIGFRPAQPFATKPQVLLIASLTENSNHLADYVAGADAALWHISNLSSGIETLQKMRQVVPDIPWGGWLGNMEQEEIAQVKIDCDFLVFSAASALPTLLKSDEVGKILEVKTSLSDGLVRTVDELPVDAVLATNEPEAGNFLTWHHLMVFQRFANLLTKPLLVSVPPNVTADELKVLWGVGVDGVIVAVRTAQPAGRLKELRQVIDQLTFPSPRQRRKMEALLPHIKEEEATETEEE